MHEKPGNEPVPCVRRRAFEQGTANAVATVPRQDRKPEFGKVLPEGHMGDADEREVIVVDAEYRVAVEINGVDIAGDAIGGERRAEPQSPVLGWQRVKMLDERTARSGFQALDGDVYSAP